MAMKFDMTEVSSLIKEEIRRYQSKIEVSQVGTVLEVGDGIARLYGLDSVMANEMLEFEGGIVGEAFNLEEDSGGAVIYGDPTRVQEGSTVRSTGRVLSVPVGESLLGRVVNALTAIGVIGGCTDANENNYLLTKVFRAGLGVIPLEQQSRI